MDPRLFQLAAPFRRQISTASVHLKTIAQPGLLQGRRIKQWTFSKRNRAQISALERAICEWI
jgi:hypothetical protein